MKKILVCSALLLLAAGASAQALWRGVPVGATPAEVSALIPEALPAPAPADRPATADGRVLLQIPAYEVVGADFAVAFGFEQDRLQSVVLRAQAGSPDQARALAQRLTASLRSRYGLEISTKSRQDPLTVGIDRKWSYRRTSVHLQVVENSVVSLRYRAEAAPSPSRL
jgi:hypothetical protein